jgi:uncharacterized membrane protein
MIEFETRISIDRPVEEVFAYVAEPRNFPSWNSAVQEVRPLSSGPSGVGSTYSMERQLPGGRATNELVVLVHEQPREFAIETTTGPTPFRYRYRFAGDDGRTVVELDARVELPGVASIMTPLVRRAVKQGVDDNLATLKQVLERPRPH